MSSYLLGIVMLRLLSGGMEIIAAIFIFRCNSLDQALKINTLLASIGPLIFLGAMYLGLTGLAEKMSYHRLAFIYAGAGLIFWGLRAGN